ncbi:MAG: FG-GAP-like repeat-containing protein, partial [Bacteroidia bacterium]
QFGQGVAAIGDLDGDLVTELAVGAPDDTTGAVWILFMDKEGKIKSAQKINMTQGGFSGELTPGGGFGSRIEALGDWDGDGNPDLLVGEPKSKTGVLAYGAVWMLLLNADGTVKNHHFFSGRTPGLFKYLPKDQRFGADIAALEDLDGDGLKEIAVGAPSDPDKYPGMVWILFLNQNGTIRETVQIGNGEGKFSGDLQTGDQFGISVESLGDLDEDGYGDLAIGAMTDRESGFDQGAIYICFLNKKGEVKSTEKIIRKKNGFTGFIENADHFGSSIANIGDMNQDSVPDLAVGAFRDDDGGKDRGAIYILYMKRNGSVKDNHKISESSRNFEGAFQNKYEWGWSISPLGDFNEDGRNDLLVNGNNHDQAGAIWMLFPSDWPTRLNQSGTWAQGAGKFSAADSARLYKNAETAADSARIDSMYDLSGYAPNNLVFLLDVSASMKKPDKLPLLQNAFTSLLTYMRPEDKISVITYSGKPTIQLSGVPASEQKKIVDEIESLKSSGETKPARAVKLAFEVAQTHFIPNGNNRVIFATDGGFDPNELDRALEKLPSKELPMSVFYFGKLPDFKILEMEEIAHKAFGNSSHITSGSVNQALLKEVKQIRLKTDENSKE